jgi:hypothetical protein
MPWAYLDLNKWIDLHKRRPGDTTRQQIEDAVEDGDIVIPLTLSLLYEEAKFDGDKIRKQVYDYMYELSDWHTLRHYSYLLPVEIERFVEGMYGNPEYDIVSEVRGKGPANLIGDFTLHKRDRGLAEREKLRKTEMVLNQKPGFEKAKEIAENLYSNQGEGWEKELHQQTQEITKNWDESFNDNSRRKRYAQVRHFIQRVLPQLIDPLYVKAYETKLPFLFEQYNFEDYIQQGDQNVDGLLRCFPSNYTHIALTNARDLQDGDKPNDIYDIFSLAVAIPYCDYVVTENRWKSDTKNANLDEEYNTEMLTSIDELAETIQNN